MLGETFSAETHIIASDSDFEPILQKILANATRSQTTISWQWIV